MIPLTPAKNMNCFSKKYEPPRDLKEEKFLFKNQINLLKKTKHN